MIIGGDSGRVYSRRTLRQSVIGTGGSQPNLPATQTISFGAKTLRGHGGHDLRYPGVGTLSITSGNGSGFWAIDSRNHLVLAGTYDAAPPSLSVGNGSYVLTIGDKTVSSVVTINVVAYEYSVRPVPTGTNADTASSFQLRTVINSGSSVNFGDVIRIRDGTVYNDDQSLDMRLRKGSQFTQRGGGPAAPAAYGDSGWVTITAEGPLGATIRRLTVEGNTVANHYIRFTGLRFERFNTAAATGSALQPLIVNSTGRSKWLRIDNCLIKSRLETGTVGTTTNLCGGLSFALRQAVNGVTDAADLAATGNFYVRDNTFEDLYDGIVMNGSKIEVIGNTFTRVWNDCMKGTYVDWTIHWNRMINKPYGDGGLHGDFFQLIQNQMVAGTYLGGTFNCNIMVRGEGRPGFADGQGVFAGNDTTPGLVFTGVSVDGNVYVGTFVNGICLESAKDARVRWNTIICDRGATSPNAATMINLAGGNDGGEVRFNAITSTSTTMVGTITGAPQVSPPSVVTPNVIGLDTDPEYAAAFASPAYEADNNTLAKVLANWAMKPGGSLDMATTGYAAHCGAVGTGYVDYVNRTVSFPTV